MRGGSTVNEGRFALESGAVRREMRGGAAEKNAPPPAGKGRSRGGSGGSDGGRGGSGGVVVRGNAADAVRVHLDAGPHGRRDRHLLDVAALRAGRLVPQHLLEGCGVVLG